jgi:hypothetical protein
MADWIELERDCDGSHVPSGNPIMVRLGKEKPAALFLPSIPLEAGNGRRGCTTLDRGR